MNLKLVVLENPLSTWHHNPLTREIFCDIVRLKSEGYDRHFRKQQTVIPFDTFDFVGTHLLLYIDDKLAMLYKTVDNITCRSMNVTFPLNNIVKSELEPIYQKVYFDFLEKHANEQISYDWNLTVGNHVAANDEQLYECLSVLFALTYHFRRESGSRYTFSVGTFFSGTNKTFLKMGDKVFQDIPVFKWTFYDHRDAVIMYNDGTFSKKSIELGEKYEMLWSRREVIGVPRPLEKLVA